MSAPPIVRKQSYGKSQVRVSRIHREGKQHDFIELTVSISLDGDFQSSYSEADNSKVIPTDTMKNTVYVLASRHGIQSIEGFSRLLGQHFLSTYAHVDRVDIHSEGKLWSRMILDGEPHDHAFLGSSTERDLCYYHGRRLPDREELGESMLSSISGLEVLKTTGSGFAGFPRDEYTTLSETDDRIFATSIHAGWNCNDFSVDWSAARQSIRSALLDVFANQYSKSVQHTLYEMGRAALSACPIIDEITINMPNKHHLLVNLAPFGMENANEVFLPTSEPFGNIGATIERSEPRNKP